jgi:transposase
MVAASKIAALKIGRGVKSQNRGRPPIDLGLVLEALFYRLRVSGPWRDLPDSFDRWRTIFGWYQKFVKEEIWEDILRIIATRAKGKARYIDGTHIRVHQAGSNPAGGAQAQAMGKTKGGRNTKLMLMTDVKGRPVTMLLIPGQAYEGHSVVALIQKANASRGLIMVGDKAYDDDRLRLALKELGFQSCFPAKSNRKESRPMHKGHYRKRYRVENCFCRLKRWASIATRRDKLASRFLALCTFAAILDWLV